MHMSLVNVITAFIDDCVIGIIVTLPFKYCPFVFNFGISNGIYVAIISKISLLLLKAKKETKKICCIVYEQLISVPFSPSNPPLLPSITTEFVVTPKKTNP